MLISKKELLAMTGISYGQLYRWKRERLIPEEWFMKQSSFTGQETFFPREQMLQRIRAIQELKDQYSLEELAKLLSPEISVNGFTMEDLESMEEINKELISTFQSILEKDVYTYIELLQLVILSKLKEELDLTVSQISGLLAGMKAYLSDMKSTAYRLVIFKNAEEYYSVIYPEQTQIHLDERFDNVKEIRIDDISNQMKVKYREKIDLQSNVQSQDIDMDNADADKEKQQSQNKEDDFIFKINNWEVRL